MQLMHQNFSSDSEIKRVSYLTPLCMLPFFLDVCDKRFSDFIGFIHAKKEILFGLQSFYLSPLLVNQLLIIMRFFLEFLMKSCCITKRKTYVLLSSLLIQFSPSVMHAYLTVMHLLCGSIEMLSAQSDFPQRRRCQLVQICHLTEFLGHQVLEH